MTFSLTSLATVAGGLAMLPGVLAGFDANSNQNRAVYWGQNSFGQAGSQSRLSYYCGNQNYNIVPIAFAVDISPPSLNFASATDRCTPFGNEPGVIKCPEIEADIISCQKTYSKSILLSLGGATYTKGGFKTSTQAITAARDLWERFGPVKAGSKKNRPFGKAVVDGFDFDFEATVTNMVPFANELRRLMDTANAGKKFFLSAAPQCPYPDAANNEMLAGKVFFDFLNVQYYNNYCGVSSFNEGAAQQWNFNFDQWDTWAKKVSRNKKVKVLLGIPANVGAGAGYTTGSKLKAAIKYSKKYTSFGGVMFWDASQLWANRGFLATVKNYMA